MGGWVSSEIELLSIGRFDFVRLLVRCHRR